MQMKQPGTLRFAVFGTGFWSHYQIPAWLEVGGVQPIAAYNRTQAGRNQLRSEDRIMREAQRVQNRISSLEKRLQTAQAGGRAVEKLSRALDNYKNPPRGYEVIARDSYRRAYNAAKKKGVNLRGFPKP